MDFYELNAWKSTQVWRDKVSAASMLQDPLDVTLYMSLVSFDNMTRAGFSMHSETVNQEVKNRLIRLMEAPFARVAASANSTWLLLIMRRLRLLKEESQYDLLTHEMCFAREVWFSDTPVNPQTTDEFSTTPAPRTMS